MMDRFKKSIEQVLLALLPNFKYHLSHIGTVIKQDTNGTLQIRFDDADLPDMVGVPICYGVPGMLVTVAPKARVFIQFVSGSPQFPIAFLWESGSVTEIRLDATLVKLNNGSQRVAREGDSVQIPGLQVLIPGNPTPIPVTLGAGLPIDGAITGGATGVEA